MLPLGLSAQEQRWFHQALVSSQEPRTRLSLMDLEHRHLADLTGLLDDGQVNIISVGEKATRSCSLDLFDPHRNSTLDGASAGTAGAFLDRMVRVTRSWWVPQMDQFVDVPMFTGPVVKAERSGFSLSVEAFGKEILAGESSRRQPRVWAQGLTRVGVSRSILQDLSGETKFDLPSVGPRSARLPENLSLTRDSDPWAAVQKLSRSMSWQGFYDGRGVFRQRALYTKPVWEFLDGDGGSVLTPPETSPDINDGDVYNSFRVIGHKDIDITRDLPPWHSRSPQFLGRNGEPRYLTLEEKNDEIRTEAEAVKIAEEMRDEHMRDTGKITWDGFIVPHLEPRDMLQLDAGGITMTARLREASFSLRGSRATYGYTKVLHRRRKRIT